MVLEVTDLRAGYGGGTTLDGVRLSVAAGQVHAVVGHNGAGKTTLLRAIAGWRPPSAGRIWFAERDLTTWPAHRRVRAGIALVPQGRRPFRSLTVAEHLRIAHRRPAGGPGTGWTPDRVLELLPTLASRLAHRGGQLSGGEQQLLAIGRALVTQPRLLLLDEPTEGLAPRLAHLVQELIGDLAATGVAVLLVSPRPDIAVATADHLSVLTTGRLAPPEPIATYRSDPQALSAALAPASPRPGEGP